MYSNNRALKSTVAQTYLGVLIHSSLIVAIEVGRVVKAALDTLAFSSLGIEYKSWHVMLQLYKM